MLYRIHYTHKKRRAAGTCIIEATFPELAQQQFEETHNSFGRYNFKWIEEVSEEEAKHILPKDWGKDLTAKEMGLEIYYTGNETTKKEE